MPLLMGFNFQLALKWPTVLFSCTLQEQMARNTRYWFYVMQLRRLV